MDIKKACYMVATSQIANPSLEVEVEGEKQKFEGRDARVFAFGILAGLRIAQEGNYVIINTNV